MAKKTKKSVRQAGAKYHDHGTKERLERGEVVVVDNQARVKKREPIDDYLAKKVINDEQWVAGFQLQIDHNIAYGDCSILGRLGEVRRGSVNVPEDKLTARDRFTKAIARDNLNTTSYQIVRLVVIEGKTLDEIHALMRWNARNTGIDRLREVLDELADFYARIRKEERDKREKQEMEAV